MKKPFTDIDAFNAAVRALVRSNPLGCTSYRTARKFHLPVMIVRERYTAKFVYEDADKKQIGSSSEVYDSAEGYRNGIHAVMSSMANIAAHRGKVRHVPGADHFSVILKCHDPVGELYFLSLARDRITVASYTDDAILRKVSQWTEVIPALADGASGG
jgi:hypothetical protein